jgi:hypothetical protein
MSLLPVAVTTMSARLGIFQCDDLETVHGGLQAQIGSISVTSTRAPAPASDWAEPLPTSP